MKKVSLYGALLILGILGLSASAAAKDHYQGHGQYHHDRELRHDEHARHEYRDRDRDHWATERHEHERHELAERHARERREREHQEWARAHQSHGNHNGWKRGRNNPHHDANWTQPTPATYGHRPTRPVTGTSTRPVAANYPTRPTRGSVQTHNR